MTLEGASRVKFGSAGNGGQIEIPDEHHTILGLHLKPNYKFCMSLLYKHSPKMLNT
jgi:hypothetical protein